MDELPAGFSSLKVPRRSDGAVEQIVNLIRSGRLTPGVKLPSEREMVEILQVSRSSYREAIRTLETIGILRVVAGRGTWVCDDSQRRAEGALGIRWLHEHERDIPQLFEMHELLEVNAAALAAERAAPEDLDRMRSAVERLSVAVEQVALRRVFEGDRDFHQAVADASGNIYLAHSISELYRSLEETRVSILDNPERLRSVVAEHQRIVDAIADRDPQGARAALIDHLRSVQQDVQLAIEARSGRAASGPVVPTGQL